MSTHSNYGVYREDMVGHADVAGTAECAQFHEKLKALNAGTLWIVANKIEPWEPGSSSVPTSCRREDLRLKVLQSLDLVTPQECGSRIVYLGNPGSCHPVVDA